MGSSRVLPNVAQRSRRLSSTTRPYLMAGGGGYAEMGKGVAAGWSLGVGVSTRTGRQTLFLESRVHAYRNALNGQPYLVPFGVVNLRHEKYECPNSVT